MHARTRARVFVCLCVATDLTIIVRSSKSATSKVGIGTGGVARGVWWGCAFLGLAKARVWCDAGQVIALRVGITVK